MKKANLDEARYWEAIRACTTCPLPECIEGHPLCSHPRNPRKGTLYDVGYMVQDSCGVPEPYHSRGLWRCRGEES